MHPPALGEFDFAMIDQPLLPKPLPDSWSDMPLQVVLPRGLESQPHVLPALLPLKTLASQQVDVLSALFLEQERSDALPVVAGLLRASESVGFLLAHLRAHLFFRTPDGRKQLLRFQDPRVLRHLCWILRPEQLAELCGPIAEWSFRGDGEWRSIQGRVPGKKMRLDLSSEQWRQIASVGLINRVLLAVGSDIFSPADEPRGLLVYRQIVRAEEESLSATDDLFAFACDGLHQHPNFTRHPRIRELLVRCRGKPGVYWSASSQITDAEWRNMANELDRKMEPSA